jgi:hypothetical protein
MALTEEILSIYKYLDLLSEQQALSVLNSQTTYCMLRFGK